MTGYKLESDQVKWLPTADVLVNTNTTVISVIAVGSCDVFVS